MTEPNEALRGAIRILVREAARSRDVNIVLAADLVAAAAGVPDRASIDLLGEICGLRWESSGVRLREPDHAETETHQLLRSALAGDADALRLVLGR